VPGWLLARAERASFAERLLADTIAKCSVTIMVGRYRRRAAGR
jgi:hypothetical protein